MSLTGTERSDSVRDRRIERLVPLAAPRELIEELPLTDEHVDVLVRGRSEVQAYAALAGKSVEQFQAPMGQLVTPEIAGTALVELVQADAASVEPAYLLTGGGLHQLPFAIYPSEHGGRGDVGPGD